MKKMKGLFIVNPSSGTQIHQNTIHEAVRDLLDNGTLAEARFVYTQRKDHALETARDVEPGEYDFIMAVGGDGTVNEVVNGIALGGHDTPLAILKAGTTNDFATVMGLPVDTTGIVRMLSEFHVERIDLGKINEKYFINVAAGGILSEIAHSVPSERKTVLGEAAYYIEGVKRIGEMRLDTVPLRFEADGFSLETETFLVIVANSRSVGGFANIAPKAYVNDGLLDVCIIKSLRPVDLVPVFSQIVTGTHTNNKCISYFQTKSLKISPLSDHKNFIVDYDGEAGGKMPAEISVVPDGLKLVVPGDSEKAKKLLKK